MKVRKPQPATAKRVGVGVAVVGAAAGGLAVMMVEAVRRLGAATVRAAGVGAAAVGTAAGHTQTMQVTAKPG